MSIIINLRKFVSRYVHENAAPELYLDTIRVK